MLRIYIMFDEIGGGVQFRMFMAAPFGHGILVEHLLRGFRAFGQCSW